MWNNSPNYSYDYRDEYSQNLYSSRIYIHNESQLVVNAINGNIIVSKEIINFVKDINSLLPYFKGTNIEYCSRNYQ